jgi:hypothetical protein
MRAAALIALLVLAACSDRKPAVAPPPAAAAGTGGAPAPTGTGGSTATAACSADADCRLFSDYCTGCDCRALARGEADPTCAGPGVRCLVEPCRDKKAACEKGRCLVRTRASDGDGYDPCAGKACGDSCKICPPSDATCMETLEVKQCNAEGKCSSMPPGCGGK